MIIPRMTLAQYIAFEVRKSAKSAEVKGTFQPSVISLSMKLLPEKFILSTKIWRGKFYRPTRR